MQSEDREKANKAFRSLLENEFLEDLGFATKLTSVPKKERTQSQKLSLNLLRDKYLPGECPSILFSSVSEELQEEYNDFHKGICEVLYGPPSIALPNH